MIDRLFEFFISRGIGKELSGFITSAITLGVILILSLLSHYIAKNTLLKIIKSIIRKSKTKADDLLIEYKVFDQLVLIISALVAYLLSPLLLIGQISVKRLAFCFIIFVVLRTLDRLLNALGEIYRKTEVAKIRPIKGLLQIFKIAIYAVGGIIIVSVLIDRSPALLLGGIGAASAVLLLVFQNTILGFVASIQLTENDMLRIGDWIEMPPHNADGVVTDISLHTVKVENWDKTVTTVPTHKLISDSFKNWRNMYETGARRIKRCIFIDINSVKFCTPEMLERFEKIEYIKEYLMKKTSELEKYNKENQADFSSPVNGRRLTNLGTFRAYLKAYLKNHPKVHSGFTVLVRQLAPSEHGLPIELYFFTNTTEWEEYENIQADIFDHIFAVISEFDLRIYQTISSGEFISGSENG